MFGSFNQTLAATILFSYGISSLEELESEWSAKVIFQFHTALWIEIKQDTGRDTLFLVKVIYIFSIILTLEFGDDMIALS